MTASCLTVQEDELPMAYTIEAAADELRTSIGGICQLIEEGHLAFEMVGKIHFIYQEHIDAYLASVESVVKPNEQTYSANRVPLVYFLFCPASRMVKIGFTENLNERLRTIQAMSPTELRLLCYIPGDQSVEARLHAQFAAHRRHFEWFAFDNEIKDFVYGEMKEELF